MHCLDTVSERGFEIYVEWLYRSRVLAGTKGYRATILDLIDAYVLGVSVYDPAFCNVTLQSIVEVCVEDRVYPFQKAVQKAYNNTTGPCALRQLFVGLFVEIPARSFSARKHGSFAARFNHFPIEFLRDLSLTLLKRPSAEAKVWTAENLTAKLLTSAPPNEGPEEPAAEN